jgi:hypothetical protein
VPSERPDDGWIFVFDVVAGCESVMARKERRRSRLQDGTFLESWRQI